MILSNAGIQEALDVGALVITPEPAPRLPTPDGRECPYQTSAVDLHLGNEIRILDAGLPINIDLRQGGLPGLLNANSKNVILTPDQPFVLERSRFVLAKTLERVSFPIREHGPWLAARVEGRSSYARCGLLIHFTAPTIHAGFEGTITLEMINLGPYQISLYPHSPICQLIIEQLASRPFRNDSQFQNQQRP